MLTQKSIQGFQLSLEQKHLWTLQQRSEEATSESNRSDGIARQSNGFYSRCLVSLTGNLDVEKLYESLKTVAERHEILRTQFPRYRGMKFPLQAIASKLSPVWQTLSLQHLSPQQQTGKIEELWQGLKRVEAIEDGESSWQLWLLTLSPEQHLLLFGLPAICADTETLKQIVAEIQRVYGGEQVCDGEDIVQYVQYTQWQKELLAEADAEAGKAYWTELQKTANATIQLPMEASSQAELSFVTQFYTSSVEPHLQSKIAEFVGHNPNKTADLLLACWQVLLWSLVGQTDFILTYLSNGRTDEELIQTLGLMTKPLPFPVRFEADWRFGEILEQVRSLREEAEQWEDYFDSNTVLNRLEKATASIGYEFIQIPVTTTVAEVKFEIQRLEASIDYHKLRLTGILNEAGLQTKIDYDPALYSSTMIRRLAEELQTILASAVSDPNQSLDRLEILGVGERQLLVDFNQTQRDFPTGECLHQYFEAQVKRTPDRIALRFETEELTYKELNSLANQLAHHLQNLGVGIESLVGISFERSPSAIVALLGVLKAGAAYLPLDPELPPERLSVMLSQAPISALVTQQNLLEKLPQVDVPVICLDTDRDLDRQPTENPNNSVTPANLAYVIFTSGSTGKPKGVAVEHRQVLNYLHGIVEQLQLSDSATYATVATLAADLGNTAIFPALCRGGCLCILSQAQIEDPIALANYCRHYPIDYLKIVPSYLETLLAIATSAALLPRKCLILGGEAASWELVRQVQRIAPDCKIVNHYGPTETTIGVLTYQVNGSNEDASTVPLGRPLGNSKIYLLDSHLQPLPIGVPGEIYISGAGLARGYFNQSDLTRERFIFSSLYADERLYQTGDKGRYCDEAGTIEFLGRVDRQIKIRGYRVELGEIEAVLSQVSVVQEGIVQAIASEHGEIQLAAYIVPKSGEDIPLNGVRDFLRERLPQYMIPASFTVLNVLPRTASGKIDRLALPEPVTTSQQDFIAPRNPIERDIAHIWAEILKVEQVSANANFFELGGHSLLATQVMSRIRSTFDIELPLRVLFETSTLKQLAEAIAQAIASQTDESELANLLTELEQLPE
ncbi:Amino acid adenylation domain protein (fragment) [Hyella patelloides LEGE 07179]|uniref:Amino acid adenylation domain protein n=1 Tax=Hyella patelloides LEGE 07179 TaxID=945734 RepID=A0A563VNK6_9CYAN